MSLQCLQWHSLNFKCHENPFSRSQVTCVQDIRAMTSSRGTIGQGVTTLSIRQVGITNCRELKISSFEQPQMA
jgi:hypothetical protein